MKNIIITVIGMATLAICSCQQQLQQQQEVTQPIVPVIKMKK